MIAGQDIFRKDFSKKVNKKGNSNFFLVKIRISSKTTEFISSTRVDNVLMTIIIIQLGIIYIF